jgi:protein-tyrosine phosphatase
MADERIRRVVCLLDDRQLSYYGSLSGGLLACYDAFFEPDRVLSAPVEDYRLTTAENLRSVLGFLDRSADSEERVVVHCSGGSGRTGHVLAAWLVHRYGLDPNDALDAVQSAGASRSPSEAVRTGRATMAELLELLDTGP